MPILHQNRILQTILPIPENGHLSYRFFGQKRLIQCDPLSFRASYLRGWVFTIVCHGLYDLVSSAAMTHLFSLFNLFLVWPSRNVSTSGSLHLFLLPLPNWQLNIPISAWFYSLVFSSIWYTLFFILYLSLTTYWNI